MKTEEDYHEKMKTEEDYNETKSQGWKDVAHKRKQTGQTGELDSRRTMIHAAPPALSFVETYSACL